MSSNDVPNDPLNPIAIEQEISADSRVLADAIGGWRGALDSAIPTAVFLLTFVVMHRNLKTSVAAALVASLMLAIARVVRKQSLQQVVSGLVGVALSAFIAVRTGKSENFFLLPIIQNALYAVLCLVSVIIRRPLLGYIVSALRGHDNSWRGSTETYRPFAAATWLWTLVFAGRVSITAPLYFAHQLEALGVAKLVLGWPLYALAVFITIRVVRPVSGSAENAS